MVCYECQDTHPTRVTHPPPANHGARTATLRPPTTTTVKEKEKADPFPVVLFAVVLVLVLAVALGTRSLPFRPLFVQWGKKSTLCAWSPLCRDGIVVIKFTKSRKLPCHRFYTLPL